MRIVQAQIGKKGKWEYSTEKVPLQNPLVLIFGNRHLMEDARMLNKVRKEFPYSNMVFGSTAGEIHSGIVNEETILVTAIEFENAKFMVKRANILDFEKNAETLGKHLADDLEKDGLRHVFVLSEGTYVNGSSLIRGMESVLDQNIRITGGMCGDGDRFDKTLASYNEDPKGGEVIIIGFYGKTLEISFASFGGWIPFGPERVVTKSEGNILYEIDNEPALRIYTKYLGEKAAELPQASLLYPLNVVPEGQEQPVVRTILGIDGNEQSMTLAGDIPIGSRTQLMMASVDGIAMGARNAAIQAMDDRAHKPQLALLVSCIGRKLVMDQRVEEEIEEVLDVIGPDAKTFGFYSYGEMAPFNKTGGCHLHNQTMTLTLISE